MATPMQLADTDRLIKVDPEDLLGPRALAFRELYLMPRAERWIEDTLYALETDGVVDGAKKPIEQLYDLFRGFVAGENLAAWEWFPKCIKPTDSMVWELRTPDLRVFGWFWKPSVFIASKIDQAKRCKDFGLYPGYREECVSTYRALPLDPPPAISGDVNDVLQI